MNINRIKVLHVDTEKGWRGGQQQAAYLLSHMHERGYKTALVCQPGSEFEDFCRGKQLPCYPVPMRGEIDFFAGLKISRICRQRDINILHLHSSHALAIGLWARLFHRNIRLIGVRRVDFPIKKSIFSRLKYTSSLVNRIVCISDNIRNVMIHDRVPEEKLTTIHSGVDINKFEKEAPPPGFKGGLGIPEDHIVVGTVAAIAGHKDYPNLLMAAKIVLDSSEKVTFCAVGDGSDRKKVHTLARDLQLGNRFIFTGFRNDVGSFLKSFDLFVLSSYLEGLGTSVLDAQAVGLPVVGCDAGGIPEMITHGENGLLVPARNSEALAEAIIGLIQNKEKRYKFGKRAKETVEKFSIKKTVEKNLKLYEELLSR
jgi:glycosyltransferase involved in cell wall biosynthesis